ncbi:MAG: ABC transporter ATP-binding protein [Bacilli bacterium]|nr:ABC transporter ATP-binding protein [Bacilli bacterium]
MSNVISIENLKFSYPRKNIFDDISLSFEKNKVTYIMGNNGSGKTTLLKILCRFLDVESGTIKILDKDIDGYSQTELSKVISYVPQSIKQNITFLVKDYLVMGRSPYIKFGFSPKEKDYEIVEKYAEELGIVDLLNRQFDELSGGQKQVVSIVKALIQETPIIIMDEPMSALDLGKQAEVLSLLSKLVLKGKTIILTTHNPNHALLFDCNVCFLDSGKIIAYGQNTKTITKENIYAVFGKNVEFSSKDSNVMFKI